MRHAPRIVSAHVSFTIESLPGEAQGFGGGAGALGEGEDAGDACILGAEDDDAGEGDGDDDGAVIVRGAGERSGGDMLAPEGSARG
jgi:hypothetical protein